MADCLRVRHPALPGADHARARIRALRNDLGVRSVMLTGDNPCTERHLAGLRTEDKLRKIAALMAQAPIAMVGDGVNDAPALAAASVSVAMGGGTDVALETANAALLNSSVTDVAAVGL